MIDPATHVISEFSIGLNPSKPAAGAGGGPGRQPLVHRQGTPPAIGMINPSTHVITEFSTGLNPGSKPGASIIVGPDGALWFMDGGTTPAIGRIDPTTHVISEFSTGLNPGAGLGRLAVGPGRQHLVRRQGHDPLDREDRPDHARDHHVHHRPQRGQPPGRDGDRLGRQRLVHRPGHDHAGDRAGRCRRPGRVGHPAARHRVGRRSMPQTCGGDRLVELGRTAAVAQRVRLRRLPVAARRQPDRRCDRALLHPDAGRRRPPALVPGHRHLHVVPGHRLGNERGGDTSTRRCR